MVGIISSFAKFTLQSLAVFCKSFLPFFMFAGLAVIYALFPNFVISSFRKDLSIAKKIAYRRVCYKQCRKNYECFFHNPPCNTDNISVINFFIYYFLCNFKTRLAFANPVHDIKLFLICQYNSKAYLFFL